MNDKLIDGILRTVLGCIFAIVGWLISNSWSRAEIAIQNLQLEVVELKLQVTKLEGKILTEDRVREIHHLEMSNGK